MRHRRTRLSPQMACGVVGRLLKQPSQNSGSSKLVQHKPNLYSNYHHTVRQSKAQKQTLVLTEAQAGTWTSMELDVVMSASGASNLATLDNSAQAASNYDSKRKGCNLMLICDTHDVFVVVRSWNGNDSQDVVLINFIFRSGNFDYL